jgi:hypothetical protein
MCSIKILLIALGVVCLSGCGLPYPLGLLHTAGDVVLADQTGKTSSEHLASEVTKKDCKWIRVIDAALVCMSKEEEIDYILSKNCETVTWNWLGLPRCKE